MGKARRCEFGPAGLRLVIHRDDGHLVRACVNSMHDSYLPLGRHAHFVNMQLGEVIFGGVGSGLYGILAFGDRRDVRRRTDGRAHAGTS